jgi:hypothetical protein
MLIGAPISNVVSKSFCSMYLVAGASLIREIIATPVIHGSYLLSLSENDSANDAAGMDNVWIVC